jgi:hypothetical protein
MRVLFILFVLVATCGDLMATSQIPERVAFMGHEYLLMKHHAQFKRMMPVFPLPVSRPLFPGQPTSTACRRGYLGRWAIRDSKLYLLKLQGSLQKEEEIALSVIRPEWKSPVLADWVTGEFELVSERNSSGTPTGWLRHHSIVVLDGQIVKVTTKSDFTKIAEDWLARYMCFREGDRFDYHYQARGIELESLLHVEKVDSKGRFKKGTLSILTISNKVPLPYKITMGVLDDGSLNVTAIDGSPLDAAFAEVSFRSLVLPPDGSLEDPSAGVALGKILTDPGKLSVRTGAGCSEPDFFSLVKARRKTATRKQMCGGATIQLQAGSRVAPWPATDKDTTHLRVRLQCHARYRPFFVFDFKTIYHYDQSMLLSFDPKAPVPVHYSNRNTGGWIRRITPNTKRNDRGSTPSRAGKRPPATPEEIDLKVGTIRLAPGFSEKMTGTKDSRRGEISRNDTQFVITYDIGSMSGLHMHPKKKATCLWFKEQMIAGQKCYIGMEKKGEDKVLTISIVPEGGAGQTRSPWTYPANFWATVKTEEDIAALTQIAMTYLPKPEKKDEE